MRWDKKRGSRYLLAAVLALAAGVAAYSWLRPAKKAEQEHALPLRLSDGKDQPVPIPSLPSIQMHLIPRTQPTPLSPVTNWEATNTDRSSAPISP